jgi:hypothetical protein
LPKPTNVLRDQESQRHQNEADLERIHEHPLRTRSRRNAPSTPRRAKRAYAVDRAASFLGLRAAIEGSTDVV